MTTLSLDPSLLDEPLRAPERRLATELRFFREIGSLPVRWRRLMREVPRGDGPLLVIPGFATGDEVTRPMRRFYRRLGYEVSGWGQGRNDGDTIGRTPGVIARAEALAEAAGRPVKVVGWSHGGILGRELARLRPELVERLITLGTPIHGGPKYTSVSWLYRRRGYDLDALEERIRERERSQPITVPVTAVYSRIDGVVHWRSSIDEFSNDVRHIEVGVTHAGLGYAPEVYRTVAHELVAPR